MVPNRHKGRWLWAWFLTPIAGVIVLVFLATGVPAGAALTALIYLLLLAVPFLLPRSIPYPLQPEPVLVNGVIEEKYLVRNGSRVDPEIEIWREHLTTPEHWLRVSKQAIKVKGTADSQVDAGDKVTLTIRPGNRASPTEIISISPGFSPFAIDFRSFARRFPLRIVSDRELDSLRSGAEWIARDLASLGVMCRLVIDESTPDDDLIPCAWIVVEGDLVSFLRTTGGEVEVWVADPNIGIQTPHIGLIREARDNWDTVTPDSLACFIDLLPRPVDESVSAELARKLDDDQDLLAAIDSEDVSVQNHLGGYWIIEFEMFDCTEDRERRPTEWWDAAVATSEAVKRHFARIGGGKDSSK